MLKRTIFSALLAILLLIVADIESLFVSPCQPQSEQSKTSDSTEKRCGFTQSVAYQTISAAVDFIDRRHDFVTAGATIVIAFFTLTLWWSTRGLMRVTNASLKLGRDEFVASQRPRLRIRNVVVGHPPPIAGDVPPPLFAEGHALTCQFFIVNIGGTPAKIIDAFAMIFQSRSGLPMHRPYEARFGNLPLPQIALASGQSIPAIFISDEVIGEGAQSIGGKTIAALHLYVMGWVEYRDDNDLIRRTSFCREFKQGPWDEGRFRRVKNRDYEHEE